MLQSRSLPNLQELPIISASFLEEFRPFLQRQVVPTSPPLSEDSASLGTSSSDFIYVTTDLFCRENLACTHSCVA